MPAASSVSTESFLESVRQSRVTGEELLRVALRNVADDSPGAAATALQAAGLLNQWQVQYLLAGHESLRIGNYLLQNRIGQDLLGEHFVACQDSLSRTVELQLLPKSLMDDSEGVERFLDSGSRLTQLDHPAILHLYDIAEHQGRYFIVTEHCESISGEDFRKLPEQGLLHLKATRDLCSAVGYLHDRGIAHGYLSSPNSIRLAKPGVVRIDKLCWGVLQRELVSRSLIETPEVRRKSDWKQASDFIVNFLSVANTDQYLSEANRSSLLKAFTQLMETGDPAARARFLQQRIDELVDRVERRETQIEPQAAVRNPSGDSGAPPEKTHSATAVPGNDRAAATAAGPKAGRNSGTGAPSSAPSRGAPRSKIPVITLASLMIISLVAFAWWLTNRGGKKSGGDLSKKGNVAINSPRKDFAAERQQGDQERSPWLLVETEVVGEGGRNGISPGSREELVIDPVGLDIPSGIGPLAGESTITPVDPAGEPATTGAEPEKGRNESIGGSKPEPGGTTKKSKDGVQEGDKGPDVTAIQDSDSKETPPFPVTFPLQDASFRELQPIGTGKVGNSFEIRIDYDPDTIGRGKNFFATVKSAAGVDLYWSRRSVDEELEKVASIRGGESGGVVFQWEEHVDEKHPANCLLNGVMEISADGFVYPVKLRESIVFDGPSIEAEKMEGRVTVVIPQMPRTDAIRIEIGTLDKNLPWTAEAFLVNEKFADKEPARIFCRTVAEEQLLWLAVSAKLASRLDVEMKVESMVGGKILQLNQRDYAAFVQEFSRQAEAFDLRARQAQVMADNAEYGSKTRKRDEAKQAKKDADAMNERAKLANQHDAWVKGLIGTGLPVRVVYETGDYTVELARSSAWADIPSSSVDETKSAEKNPGPE